MTWFLDREFLAKLDLDAYDAAAIAEHVGVPLDVARAFVHPLRRYWVKSYPDYGWLAGASGERLPTLLFVGAPRLSGGDQHPLNAVSFDPDMGMATHTIPFEGELDWEPVLEAAKKAIGFIHVGNAPVRTFKHPTLWHYAVVPFPSHLHDDATGVSGEPVDMVRGWILDEKYVLHCGNAYYMGREGDVDSS
jgi:hypothetical protein